jgi:serine O-acetyltransferase
MAVSVEKVATCDPIWSALRAQAEEWVVREPALASLVHATVLKHDRLENALSYHLAKKIGSEDVSPMMTREIFEEALTADSRIGEAVRADLSAVFERDPACKTHVEAFLFYKGFHALQCYRIAHWLWTNDRRPLALFFQSRISELFDVDIHPAARLGRGIMIDHATGVVIGETAVVEDDVSMLHGVTLGGTGKETGDRHPKIRRGVLLSMGAKVLGNIEIGEYSRVGAGSVVLKPVPPGCTAVGVPAKLVNCAGSKNPSQDMNQVIEETDFSI